MRDLGHISSGQALFGWLAARGQGPSHRDHVKRNVKEVLDGRRCATERLPGQLSRDRSRRHGANVGVLRKMNERLAGVGGPGVKLDASKAAVDV